MNIPVFLARALLERSRSSPTSGRAPHGTRCLVNDALAIEQRTGAHWSPRRRVLCAWRVRRPMSFSAAAGRYYDPSRADPPMTELRSETQTRGQRLRRAGCDVRLRHPKADGESDRAVLLMTGSPMDASVTPSNSVAGTDPRDVRPAWAGPASGPTRPGYPARRSTRMSSGWRPLDGSRRFRWERLFDVDDEYLKEDESQ
jgi:hypothetical protein